MFWSHHALQQIKDKGYADKYPAGSKPIHPIGVALSKATRSVMGFVLEALHIK